MNPQDLLPLTADNTRCFVVFLGAVAVTLAVYVVADRAVPYGIVARFLTGAVLAGVGFADGLLAVRFHEVLWPSSGFMVAVVFVATLLAGVASCSYASDTTEGPVGATVLAAVLAGVVVFFWMLGRLVATLAGVVSDLLAQAAGAFVAAGIVYVLWAGGREQGYW